MLACRWTRAQALETPGRFLQTTCAAGPGVHDVAVVGAGCIGASVAKHLAEAGHSVVVLEKEAAPAMHQSGRNSGVIHAGYNLKPGSAKARYCVEGSRRMRAYCVDRGVVIEQGGILVAAVDETGRASVARLLEWGRANGVDVRAVDEAGIRDIEPHARGSEGLHAPEGASVDAVGYVQALVADATEAGADFRYRVAVKDATHPSCIRTSRGDINARVLVNAAGLHADRIAGSLARDLRVVPFRGYYAQLAPAQRLLVRSHVYQAPDPRFPFLGVHVSRRVDGAVVAGPGAMLAFGREAYRFASVSPRDLAGTLAWPGFWRLLADRAFRRMLPSEVRKSLVRRAIGKEAQRLVPAVDARGMRPFPAGVRAQLVDRAGHLLDDILVRKTDDAVHVLNAVSPGLTCSLPFGQDVARQAAAKL